jgi:hypothetical protein
LGGTRGGGTKQEFTPGVHIVVDTTMQRVDLICPRCNTRRSFTDVILTAMTIPEVVR